MTPVPTPVAAATPIRPGPMSVAAVAATAASPALSPPAYEGRHGPAGGSGLLVPAELGALQVTPVAVDPPGEPAAVWLVDTTALRDEAARQAAAVLDAEERERAGQFRHAADRDGYVCAHVALRRLLGAYLGLAPADVRTGRAPCPHCGGPHGRPVLPDGLLHFSLSHCADLSLLAFATVPVGVDVEVVPDPRTVAETADVLHPREAAELSLLAPADRPLAFTRVWTRKEAYLKGRGVGLSDDPAADYVGSGAAPAALPGGWSLTDVLVPRGHWAAVAVHLPARSP